mgnify:CR=1 FL=1
MLVYPPGKRNIYKYENIKGGGWENEVYKI